MVYVPAAPLAKNQRARAIKAPKYKNKRVAFRGLMFDSIGERDRYIHLLQDQEEGLICNLKRQVKFPLTCNGVVVCHYIADFVYDLMSDKPAPGNKDRHFEVKIVEDFKGVLTDTFLLKAKMFKACYGFDITITKRSTTKVSKK